MEKQDAMNFKSEIPQNDAMQFLGITQDQFKNSCRVLRKFNLGDFGNPGIGRSRVLSVADVFFLMLLRGLLIKPKYAELLLPSLATVVNVATSIDQIPNFCLVKFPVLGLWEMEIQYSETIGEAVVPGIGIFIFPFRENLQQVQYWASTLGHS